MKFVFYLIPTHIFVCINYKDMLLSDNNWCAPRLIEFTDEKLKPKVQIENVLINRWGRILIRYSIYR